MKVDLVGNILYSVFHYCICIMHIYILRMHAFVLHNNNFFKDPYYFVKRHKKTSMTKLQEKSPLVILTCWSLNIARDLEPQGQKGSGITKSDMASEKNMRMEEIGNGQQEMQEKIAQMTKMVTSLTKGKGITDDPSLQREPMSWKDGIDSFTVPNQNDLCEQEN